jgi:recyclin-1
LQSEEVAINLLQLTKVAFKRCQVLAPTKDLSSSAVEILSILISYLLSEHIDYALEIGLQGIPLPG